VDRALDRVFRGRELLGHLAVGGRGALAGDEALEVLELPASIGILLLAPQARQRALEDGERPAALEDLLRGQVIDRLEPVAALDLVRIERDDVGASAALPGLRLLALFRQEVLDRGHQEDPEASALGVVIVEVALLEQLGEVGLRQVAGLLWTIALPPHQGVDRVPVDPAESLQRLARLRRGRVPRRQDLCPARRRKPSVHRQRPAAGLALPATC
jgi:hypothetical protein